LHRQQTEKDKQNVDFTPSPGKISANAHVKTQHSAEITFFSENVENTKQWCV